MGDITLRPYQREAISAAYRAWDEGHKSVIWSMATGLGKTVAFSAIACRRFKEGHRTLILAHREELLDQAREKLVRCAPWIGRYVDIVQGPRDELNAAVVIASVQSIRQERRLKRYKPGYFAQVIVDEAHHTVARTYRQILEAVAPRWLLGVTATTSRGDGVGLMEMYDVICYEYGMRKAIDDGWLRDLRVYEVITCENLDSVKTRAGEFVESQLAEECNTPERNAMIVESWREKAEDRKTVAFAVNVEHAMDLAATFRNRGYRAEPVWGAMGSEARKAALGRLRDGRTQIICNCAVLTEGFDEPTLGCILLTRPCRSMGLVTQMVGRGTRLCPGMADTIVMDFHGLCRRGGLATAAELVGLSIDELDGRSSKAIREDQATQAKRKEKQVRDYLASPMKARLVEVDPWTGGVVTLRDYDPGNAGWKAHDASDRQREILMKRGMQEETTRSLSKGEASHLIDQIAELEGWLSEQDAMAPAPAAAIPMPISPDQANEVKALRMAIQRMAIRRDRSLRLEMGSTNRELYSHFRKPRQEMTVAELQSVLEWFDAPVA